jgi:hypothetical protein
MDQFKRTAYKTLATTLERPTDAEIARTITTLCDRICATFAKAYADHELVQIAPTVQAIPGREAVQITVTILAYRGAPIGPE